ncbi:MAG: FimV/HubP family polar landmark protein [Gammaproteobacteria bacterium]
MLRRLAGATLFLLLAWSGTVQALGLGDIRLQSALNEPFRAEIDLLSVTDEELGDLEIRLAPVDTFRRYGIDRPSFLSGFRFDVRPLPGDRGVVVVTSTDPIPEPFVTFLAEAVWPRGRLLREYTVLLDPPTFASEERAPAPVRAPAPAVSRSADTGTIRREPQPQPQPRRSDASLEAGGTYRVQRNETLWSIAERVRPAGSGLAMNQVMIALYEANPQAFDGNINILREGAVLQIPAEQAMYGINRSDATAVVSRQNEAWRGGESDAGRLRLVPPDEDTAAAASVGGTGGADRTGGADSERVRSLEEDVAERDRLLAIKDRELAELREQLAAREAEQAAAAVAETTAEPADAAPGVDLETEGEAAGEIFAEPETATPVAEESATPGEESVPEEPATAEPARTPAVVTTAREPEKGLFDNTLIWLGLGVLAIAIALLYVVRRRRQQAEEEEAGDWQALEEDLHDEEDRSATERLHALEGEAEPVLVVEKEGDFEYGDYAGAAAGLTAASLTAADAALAETEADAEAEAEPEAAAAAAEHETRAGDQSLDDTFSSETALDLDQSDPLAEADFHMAYGLYDQAADLVRGAIAEEPERTDLRAKLAEVYFVWGNRDAFVDAAENLHEALAGEKDADWDRIVIMGRQIAPEHGLFAGAVAGDAGGVDLTFEEGGGAGRLDVDLGGDEAGDLDLVLGDGGEDVEADLTDTDGALDFDLDESGEWTRPAGSAEEPDEAGGEGTQTFAVGNRFAADELSEDAPTVETPWETDTEEAPTVETPLDEDTRESRVIESAFDDVDETLEDAVTQEAPTMETWAADRADETRELPSTDDEAELARGEHTAEIDLDDLGLDLDDLAQSGEQAADLAGLEDLGEEGAEGEPAERADDTGLFSAEEVTMLAPGGAAADEPIGEEDETTIASPDEDDSADTLVAEEDDRDRLRDGDAEIDFDLDDLAAVIEDSELGDLDAAGDETAEPPAADESGRFSAEVFSDEEAESFLDLDVGDVTVIEEPAVAEPAGEEEAWGRTQTEVGTKLDLARAYVDMGDPDGARSILEEVLEEGDDGQRQEANRMLEALAG